MEVMANYFRTLKRNLEDKFLARFHLPQPPQPPPAVREVNNPEAQLLDWPLLIIGYCLTSAIEIALQSLQLPTDQHIPSSVLLLSVAMVLAFATTFVAKIISLQHPNHARLLVRAGIFFVATAFYLAITTPFPLCLTIVSWFVCVVSFLAIFVYMFLPSLRRW